MTAPDANADPGARSQPTLASSSLKLLLDRTFYRQHMDLRNERFPVHSEFFEVLHEFHEERRLAFDAHWGASSEKPISEASRQVVNTCFETVDRVVRAGRSGRRLASASEQRCRLIYAYRLGPGATVADFRACDIFDGVLLPSDTDIPVLLSVAGPREDQLSVFRDRMCHVFLHAAQRTPYIFWHELAVSHFGNRCVNDGRLRDRRSIRLCDLDTWGVAALFFDDLARLLELPADELAELHFGEREELERILPQPILDLMTLSGQLYWYLEVFLVKLRRALMTEALNLLISFFTVPALHHYAAERARGVRPTAGELIDEAFLTQIFGHDGQERAPEPSEVDVARLLSHLADAIWQDSAPAGLGRIYRGDRRGGGERAPKKGG